MKKIAVTGAKGTVGTILQNGLSNYSITPIDLPEIDVRDYRKLTEIFPRHDVIIHLAWDLKKENFKSGKINPDNSVMFYNVYRAALETRVHRVIMASSVHADYFYDWEGPELIGVNRIPEPDSPYGADKVFMESLGRYYAKRGLEVVCIRFGGVNPEGRTDIKEKDYQKIWLSHRDCISLMKSCIKAPRIPDDFLIIYGISNNAQRVHDYSNPLGWEPKDNASDW